MSESSSEGGRTATACASQRLTGSSNSFSKSSPFCVMRQNTRRRSLGQGVRATRSLRSSRSTSLVTPGVCSIMRSPMLNVGKPSGPAPRRIRSTLYCCGVIPCGSMTCARLRFTASAVRNKPSVACCSRERKVSGGFGGCGFCADAIISESIIDSDIEQANGGVGAMIGAARIVTAQSRVVAYVPFDGLLAGPFSATKGIKSDISPSPCG
jgi:hypothetical protein